MKFLILYTFAPLLYENNQSGNTAIFIGLVC